MLHSTLGQCEEISNCYYTGTGQTFLQKRNINNVSDLDLETTRLLSYLSKLETRDDTEPETHKVKTPGSSLSDYEFCLGLWQRTNLEYYGEVIHVFHDENRTIVFQQIVPSDSAGLQRLKFLTISLDEENQVVTENLSGLTSGENAEVFKEEEDGEISLRIEVDNETGPHLSYRNLLRSFNKTQNIHRFRRFVQSKLNHDRSFCFQPLLTRRWMEKYHRDFRSGSSILEKLKPGVFSAYNDGLELIHLRDGQGVKITGDPIITFNEVTFRVTSKHRIDLPLEIQTDYKELTKATENFEQYLVDEDQVCFYMLDPGWRVVI